MTVVIVVVVVVIVKASDRINRQKIISLRNFFGNKAWLLLLLLLLCIACILIVSLTLSSFWLKMLLQVIDCACQCCGTSKYRI